MLFSSFDHFLFYLTRCLCNRIPILLRHFRYCAIGYLLEKTSCFQFAEDVSGKFVLSNQLFVIDYLRCLFGQLFCFEFYASRFDHIINIIATASNTFW